MAPAVDLVTDSTTASAVQKKTGLKSPVSAKTADAKAVDTKPADSNGVDAAFQKYEEGSFIWGCQLAKSSPSYTVKLTTSDPDNERHVVELKSASLGPEAADGERNVVQIEAEDWRGEKHKRLVTSLTAGQVDSVRLDLTLSWTPDKPIILTLVSGTGPLTLTGTHFLGLTRSDDVNVASGDEVASDVETDDESTGKSEDNMES